MTSPSLRLEVLLDAGWTDLLSPTHSISWNRAAMDVSTLTATILDARLDPSQAETLRSGRPIRLMAATLSGWRHLYVGKVSQARVSYPRFDQQVPDLKRARIEVTAVDAMQALGTAVEPRSVATANELRTLLAASGVPWRVNGTTTAGPATPLVVAYNDGSYLADQVAVTRDTLSGYAWVANDGVLNFYGASAMSTQPVGTFSDVARAGLSYSAVDVSFDSADVLDEVTVEFMRYKPVAGATENITYGPYRQPRSTGTNAKTFTIVGATEDEAAIEAFAQSVLAKNSTAQVRPLSMSTPVRSVDERTAAVAMEPCALVRVVYEQRLDALVRVETADHTVTANPDNFSRFPDGIAWTTSYTFGPPEAVAPPQRLAILTQAPVQDRLETTEEVALLAEETATSAEQRTTGQKEAETVTNLTGARVHLDHDNQGRGRARWFGEDGTTIIGQIRGIVDDLTSRYIFGISGGDQTNPSRARLWTYLVDGVIRRRIDLICDEAQINGLIQGTNGLTLQLSPTILKGFDGNSNVTRVLSNTGTTTVPHTVSGGGTTHITMRGGNAHLFHAHVGSVTGTDVTFQFRYRSDNSQAVNETVTFDWSVWAFDRPTPVV